eukprot:IDg19641t1
MTGTGRVLRLLSRDVYTNLAAEEILFQHGPPNSIIFYINRASVVLGRTQNVFVEANVAHAAAHGVEIARRRSGGGYIVANGLKISGNAYRISRDRAYHHGTVLVRSDLDSLRSALRSPIRDRIKALGTSSVRSPVANIIDFCPGVNVDDVVDAIARSVGAQ